MSKNLILHFIDFELILVFGLCFNKHRRLLFIQYFKRYFSLINRVGNL